MSCLWRCREVETSAGDRDVVFLIESGHVLKPEDQVGSVTGGTLVPVSSSTWCPVLGITRYPNEVGHR